MKRSILFTAKWCTTCVEMNEMMEKIKIETPIEKYDHEDHPTVFGIFQIDTIPTLLKIEGGMVIDKIIGKKTEQELTEWFNT